MAFAQFGYEDIDLEDFQFIPWWTGFYIGSGIKLDILLNMVGMEGCSFDESLNLTSVANIENIPVPFLHINQLIVNKKAVNRQKNQIDVMELEKIKELRKEMGLD